jgi:hypothetical protein
MFFVFLSLSLHFLSSSSFPVSDWERTSRGSASPLTDNLRQSLSVGIPRQSLGTRKPSASPSQPTQRRDTGKEKSFCSEQNIENLITPLLRDLPSYTNRASQRARRLKRKTDVYSYMALAGKPDFTPLPLNGINTTDAPKSSEEKVEQVFFTTLERQYIRGRSVQLQEFHWLFLTKSQSGWRMVTMFSQIGSYPVTKNPPTPPRDSSNGTVAQGINAWLRDCRAGSIRMSSAN